MVHEPLLSVKDLHISFESGEGRFSAVEGINFHVNKGEIFALVGESGCGKSTTAYGITRLLPSGGKIDRGEIFFEGKDIAALQENQMPGIRGSKIGMIFQNPLDSLNPVYSVGHQITEGLILDNVSKQEALKKVLDIFKDVRIPDPEIRVKNFPHELSGGMRQRVMIGMMLSRRPKLLIADEPTTALDVTIQAQILELIKDLKVQFQTSVLIITHDFGVVAEIADRVGVMYAGQIVETGEVSDIFENPKHPYTRLLLRALPKGTKKEGRLKGIGGAVPDLTNLPAGCRFHPRCPYANAVCSEKTPGMRYAGHDHQYYCHLEVKNSGTFSES